MSRRGSFVSLGRVKSKRQTKSNHTYLNQPWFTKLQVMIVKWNENRKEMDLIVRAQFFGECEEWLMPSSFLKTQRNLFRFYDHQKRSNATTWKKGFYHIYLSRWLMAVVVVILVLSEQRSKRRRHCNKVDINKHQSPSWWIRSVTKGYEGGPFCLLFALQWFSSLHR